MDTKVGSEIKNKSTRQSGRVLEVDEKEGTCRVELPDADQVWWSISDTRAKLMITDVPEAK